MKPATVTLSGLRRPITEDQHEKVKLNDKVARALVRRANDIDLEAIAEKVRR